MYKRFSIWRERYLSFFVLHLIGKSTIYCNKPAPSIKPSSKSAVLANFLGQVMTLASLKKTEAKLSAKIAEIKTEVRKIKSNRKKLKSPIFIQ